MIELRDYQTEAIDRTSEALQKGVRRPLIIAPTASGKSLIIAGMIKRALERNATRRILSLSYQSEILEQNESALLKLLPSANAGIYCAGTGRKESDRQVIFASRDSLGPNPSACGDFEFVIVDEAHQVSSKAETRYQKIFSKLDPKWVVGLTGTPFRMDNGNIWGEQGYFEAVSYNIKLDFLVNRGFLCPYIFPRPESAIIDTQGVRVKSTGDFDENELEQRSSTDEVVQACVQKWLFHANDRKVSLFFCCSVAHAEVVTKAISEKIGFEKVAYLDGKTKKDEREFILSEAKKGRFKAIVNVGVLTTGVDIPIIDCVVMLRATRSASLFVQSCGRGLRTFPGKENLLILDMTDNFQRFGSLSNPVIRTSSSESEALGEPTGEQFPKKCPSCDSDCQPSAKVCSYCGHVFINHSSEVETKIETKTSGWFKVENYYFRYAKTKRGQDCMIATFKLAGIKRTLSFWHVYGSDNEFVRKKAGFHIGTIKTKFITDVYIQDLNADFPSITRYLDDPARQPMPEIEASEARFFG